MPVTDQQDVFSRLARQSLGRPLVAAEETLSEALESIFKTGCHDFTQVSAGLQARGIARPSGEPGAWSPAVLEMELANINASLDQAYGERGSLE
jgi:hypothetical protein